jgi:ABC-2 type transport system permease protein
MSAAARVLGAFLRRDWRIALSYRLPFVLDAAAVALQLFIAYFIGRTVSVSADAGPGLDQGYFAFAAVGVAVLGVLQVGLVSFGLKLRDEQASGTLEALLAAPLPAGAVVLAGGAYEVAREAVIALTTFAVAVVLLGVDLHAGAGDVLLAALAFALELALVVAIGVLVAAFALVFKQAASAAAGVSGFVAASSGVWFPVGSLPAPLDAIAGALPTTWGLDVVRDALLGGDPSAAQAAGLAIAAVAGLPLALAVLGLALRRARRDGSLGQY